MGPVAAGKRPHGLPRPYLETGRRHPLFAENDLTLEVGRGADTITVIRTPARYASFRAVVTDPPPTAGEHNAVFLARP